MSQKAKIVEQAKHILELEANIARLRARLNAQGRLLKEIALALRVAESGLALAVGGQYKEDSK